MGGAVHRRLGGGGGLGVAHLGDRLLHIGDWIDRSVARLGRVVCAGLGRIFRFLWLTVGRLGRFVRGLLLVDLFDWRRAVVGLLWRTRSPGSVLRSRSGRRAVAGSWCRFGRTVARTGLHFVRLFGWWWRRRRRCLVDRFLGWGLPGGVI